MDRWRAWVNSWPRLSLGVTSLCCLSVASNHCLLRTFLQLRRAPTSLNSNSRRGLVPPPPVWIITRSRAGSKIQSSSSSKGKASSWVRLFCEDMNETNVTNIAFYSTSSSSKGCFLHSKLSGNAFLTTYYERTWWSDQGRGKSFLWGRVSWLLL